MTATVTPAIRRPTFDDMNLSTGKRTRLHRLMYEHGPANGTLMMLPIDQGLEHGPIDFFDNPDSIDTDWIYRLAVEGNFSGIALHIGLAEKYHKAYAGRVPLVLKVNGKTNVPSDDDAFSPLTSSVEDAVRLGADAVGYTLYVGSPAQDVDIAQCNEVRRECDRYGMPLVDLGLSARCGGQRQRAASIRSTPSTTPRASRARSAADVIKLNEPEVGSRRRSQTAQAVQHAGVLRRRRPAQGREVGRPHARARFGRQQDGRRRDHAQGAHRDGGRLRRTDLRAQHVAAQLGRRADHSFAHPRRPRSLRPTTALVHANA